MSVVSSRAVMIRVESSIWMMFSWLVAWVANGSAARLGDN